MDQMDSEHEGSEAEEVILASIDRFLERDVKPYVRKLEHDDAYPGDIVARMKELGLSACSAPLRPETGVTSRMPA